MKLEDICALPVADLAAPDCALFLWVVQPQLPEAMKVIDSWGFKFRTVAFAWIKMPGSWVDPSQQYSFLEPRAKPRMGLGYHSRSGMEQCWLAIRGKGYKRHGHGVQQVFHSPESPDDPAEVLHSPVREHSRKPDEFAKRIVDLVGSQAKRVELFARTQRPGWEAWGAETGKFKVAV
jgi:N6-adenosine-specific RNA methylase IME4